MDLRLFTNTQLTPEKQLIIDDFQELINNDLNTQVYLITSPLGEKYTYDYEDSVLVVLIPKHKIVFLNLKDDNENFEYFVDDFIEDLSSISDKYNYKAHIGRPRKWIANNTLNIAYGKYSGALNLINESKILDAQDQRVSDLLISLLIGSINDIKKIGAEVPVTLLEKVKKNIILFDGEQTRFIYQDFSNKKVVIQGLSGTGKTELLLHKLKDLYINYENAKIFFTCHNIALANTLRARVPEFFNFMKVEKQIEWNKNLWVDRAWGSRGNKNSGLYSYLCHFYNIPFLRYTPGTDYTKIFTLALEHIQGMNPDNFEYAFDYILIDERQDFPEVFFDLCEKVTKYKVFVAGDIFQDIFESSSENILNVDVVLNKCYRTDPRTLMFAHSIGLGLFENKKWNWFEDKEWEALGYIIERYPDSNEIHFSRNPIRRFEDIDVDEFNSMEIIRSTTIQTVLDTIKAIISQDSNISANDIAIITLEDNKGIYEYIDKLAPFIFSEFGWTINRAHESKSKIDNSLYISSPNNVKGLEFPFVICLSSSIKNTYRYRNILYTMLTRSFIKSYLLTNEPQDISHLESGLEIINRFKYIKTIEPSEKEKGEIKNNLIKFLETPNQSYKEFLDEIFADLNIDEGKREGLEASLLNAKILQFDKDTTIKFIESNKDFY
jgi:superfamily I DNA and RNA helicase